MKKNKNKLQKWGPKGHPKPPKLGSQICFLGGSLGAVLKSDQYLRLYVSKSIGSAIHNPDRFEQVVDPYDISMVRRQKMRIFGVLKAFISKFTYYNLY